MRTIEETGRTSWCIVLSSALRTSGRPPGSPLGRTGAMFREVPSVGAAEGFLATAALPTNNSACRTRNRDLESVAQVRFARPPRRGIATDMGGYRFGPLPHMVVDAHPRL